MQMYCISLAACVVKCMSICYGVEWLIMIQHSLCHSEIMSLCIHYAHSHLTNQHLVSYGRNWWRWTLFMKLEYHTLQCTFELWQVFLFKCLCNWMGDSLFKSSVEGEQDGLFIYFIQAWFQHDMNIRSLQNLNIGEWQYIQHLTSAFCTSIVHSSKEKHRNYHWGCTLGLVM